jgi:zinc transport system substrate-binding protein
MLATLRSAALPLIVACTAAILGCTSPRHEPAPQPAGDAAARPEVYVVNYPLKYFAQRIGGDHLAVVFPAPTDEDPAFWQPDEPTILAYQNADLILLNGAGYARWTEHVSLPPSRLIDTSQAFQDQYITLEDRVVHQHGPDGEHVHEGYAFTTWLDPRQAIQQAEAIYGAFSSRWPDRADVFRANWQALEADLHALDVRLTEVNAGYEGQPLLASHPVYHYLARRCEWDLRSVHWEPDELPDDEQWQELQQLLEEHPARWMIWEDAPLEETAQRLQALGVGRAIVIPCENTPDSGDYLDVMYQNLVNLEAIFAGADRGPD